MPYLGALAQNIYGTAETVRTNFVRNPSFEVNTTTWTATTSDGTIARTTATSLFGAAAVRITRVTTGGPTAQMTESVNTSLTACTAGDRLVLTGYVRSGNMTRSAAVRLRWFNSALTLLSEVTGTSVTTSTSWQRASVTGTVPTNAAYVACAVTHSTAMLINETADWDGFLLETGTIIRTYFDGSSVNAQWSGTANASTSTLIQ